MDETHLPRKECHERYAKKKTKEDKRQRLPTLYVATRAVKRNEASPYRKPAAYGMSRGRGAYAPNIVSTAPGGYSRVRPSLTSAKRERKTA